MDSISWRLLGSRSLALHPLTRAAQRWMRRRAARLKSDRYLAESSEPKLHVGCGPYSLEGWLNADIDLKRGNVDIFLDAREPLPFEEGQFHFVFAEHLLEHLGFDEGRRFLKEVSRVLKPGGVVRISTPDLEFLLRYYSDSSHEADRYTEYHGREFLRTEVRSRALVVSNFFYDFGHRVIYDWDLLVKVLEEAGLRGVERRQVGESPHEALRGIEQHGSDYPFNVEESMVAEAVKP